MGVQFGEREFSSMVRYVVPYVDGPPSADLPSAISDLETNAKPIQDRISGLMSARKTPSSPQPTRASRHQPRYLELERLQARLDAAEDENARLRPRMEQSARHRGAY